MYIKTQNMTKTDIHADQTAADICITKRGLYTIFFSISDHHNNHLQLSIISIILVM